MTAICRLDAQICKFFYHIIVEVWQRPGIFIPFQPFWLHFSLIFGFWAKMLAICFGFSPTRDEVAWLRTMPRKFEIFSWNYFWSKTSPSFWECWPQLRTKIKFWSKLDFVNYQILNCGKWLKTEMMNFTAFRSLTFYLSSTSTLQCEN